MSNSRNPYSGNTTMLVLKLLGEADMYGYQITQVLAQRSQDVFSLKTGTLYPILHGLEHDGMISAYEQQAETGKLRRYYHITEKGCAFLKEKETEWETYAGAVRRVLRGEGAYVFS